MPQVGRGSSAQCANQAANGRKRVFNANRGSLNNITDINVTFLKKTFENSLDLSNSREFQQIRKQIQQQQQHHQLLLLQQQQQQQPVLPSDALLEDNDILDFEGASGNVVKPGASS